MRETKKKPDKHYYELLDILHEQSAKMEPKELRKLHKEITKYTWFGVPFMYRYPEFPLYFSICCLLLVIFRQEVEWLICRMIQVAQLWKWW